VNKRLLQNQVNTLSQRPPFKRGERRGIGPRRPSKDIRGPPPQKSSRKYEDYAIVLDYIPKGIRIGQKENIAQAIGETWFTLLELIPNKGYELEPFQRVGIGKNTRKEIKQIKGRIGIDELTKTATDNLRKAIEIIVKNNERRFVEFLNKAQPITTRMHSIELIPGIGKKTMLKIVKERQKVPFTSFEDLEERTGLHEPEKMFVERIMKELEGNEKYHLFTRPKTQR